MGRLLSTEQFGVLGLLVAIFLFCSMPTSAVGVMVVNRVARLDLDGRDATVTWFDLFRRRSRYAAFAFVLAIIPLSPLLKSVFNLDSVLPVVTIAAALAFWLILTVNRGALQGLREFNLLSASLVLEAVLRVGVAVALVAIWPTAQAAATGILISCLLSWALTLAPVRRRLHRSGTTQGGSDTQGSTRIRIGLREASGAITGLAVIAAMQNADVFAAKAHLNPDQTGKYVAVATLGKAFFFFSLAIATAMLPEASASRGEPGRGRVVIRSAAVVIAIAIPALGIAAGFSNQIVSLVYGADRAELAGFLGPITLSSVLLALGYLLLNYLMALGRTRYIPVMVTVIASETLALTFWAGSSVMRIVATAIIANGLLAVALTADAAVESRQIPALETA